MKTLKIVIAALCLSVGALAQAPSHSVTLSWNPPADATSASTVTVFRAAGACTGTPSFSSLASTQPMTAPYVDSTVTVGTFCYAVQHNLGGAVSVNSNLAPATVSPLPITTLTVTVK